MKITTVPFHKGYIDNEEIKAVTAALKSGWHTMGPKTVEFEDKFRAYIGARHAIAVNSCTAALHLALEAVGVKQGDEVIVPAITFTATAEVVCYFGAVPVLVDVEPDTMNLDCRYLEQKITKRTKAIISVDFAGLPCDYNALQRIARKHSLYLIADAAHCLPSYYHRKSVGTLADITCFSFYATKTLNTGEGGMITTNNAKWAERMKIMRLHGMNRDAWKRYTKAGNWFYEVVEAGYKYNTTDINAALGLAQLRKINFMWKKRIAVADRYTSAFSKLGEVTPPTVSDDCQTSWHLYVLKLNLDRLRIDRSNFITELGKRGISASVHFIPLYRHPFYRDKFGYKNTDFKNAEWVYERIVSLPIFPGMTKKQIAQVISAVKDICKQFAS